MIARYRFSRKVIWLEVASTNNDSAVIAGYYLSAVEKYGAEVSLLFFFFEITSTSVGCPIIVRGDRGTENSRIAYLQPFLRKNGEGADNSFQYGRSASNQVCQRTTTSKVTYRGSYYTAYRGLVEPTKTEFH